MAMAMAIAIIRVVCRSGGVLAFNSDVSNDLADCTELRKHTDFRQCT